MFSVRANVFPSVFEPFTFRTPRNVHWNVPEKLSNSAKITLPFNLDQNPRSSKHSFAKCGARKPDILKWNMLHMLE